MNPVKPKESTYPDVTRFILTYGDYTVVTECIFVVRQMFEVNKRFRFTVKQIQPVISGSDPDTPFGIFEEVPKKICCDAIVVVNIIFKDLKVIAVILVQTVIGCEPHKTVMILNDAIDHPLRKSIVDCNGFKPEVSALLGN